MTEMKTRLKEFVIYSGICHEIASLLYLTRSIFCLNIARRLEHLTRAYYLAQSRLLIDLLAKILANYLPPIETNNVANNQCPSYWSRHKIGWNRYHSQLASAAATRTLILKAPGPNGEKGVIISCFEYNWLRILSEIKSYEVFDQAYTLVFSTSWSPTNYNILALALEKISGPVFVVPCNYKEIEKLKRFHPRIQPLDLLACDWLNPSCFQPKPWKDRTIDILVVSNWAPFKRHQYFFKVLCKLPANLRVVCVGQPEGSHTLDHIRQLKATLQVPQEIEFLERIPIEQVNALQCDSKIAAIFSLREGCCVAAVEGLMAGAYLAMLDKAHVGPLDYINPQTGARLNPGTAAKQIEKLLQSEPEISPHQWATDNISCHQTGLKLNAALKNNALQTGTPWEADIAVPYWRPFPRYVKESDEKSLTSSAEKLTLAYPEVFPKNWTERSHF